ncbi:MAG: hypothetical protein H0W72_09020 [Planctomycetes bacterium]|nr:hypothetical protein [Planctomycetota bacterium]
MHRLGHLVLALALAAGAVASAESFDQRLAKTNLADADAVFELAQWCAENNLPTKARRYYSEVIKLSRDHDGARTALGQVRVGDRWVSEKMAGGGAAAPAAGATDASGRKASGRGPSADEVAWDLTPPKDPQPHATFIDTYIERMPRVDNDSRDMDVSIATLAMEEHQPVAVPRLSAALLRPDFGDLYGASMFLSELLKQGRTAEAKKLLPALVKASARVEDVEDLSSFAFSAGMVKDRRVVPRLIQLLGHSSSDVQSNATAGIAAVTLLPEKDITAARAQSWWDLNHNVDDRQIYHEQLNSSDPRIAVEAAKALYDYRDKAIVPVLIKLLKVEDRTVCNEAIDVIRRITGQTWSYDPAGSAEEKKKRAEQIEKWWKDEQFRFTWIEDNKTVAPGQPAEAPKDQSVELVEQLASVDGAVASLAQGTLRGKGKAAVPALLDGLAHGNRLVRRRSGDVLKVITQQALPYDAAGSEEQRASEIAAWRAWAVKNGFAPAEGAQDKDAEAE